MSDTTASATLNPEFPRQYVAPDADFGSWETAEEYYRDLVERPVESREELEKWLLDMSELDAVFGQEGTSRHIDVTCATDDPVRKQRHLDFLHDGGTYGKGLADATKGRLNEGGVNEAMYASYTPGEVDYSDVVSKMQGEDIDVFYVGGYSTEAALMVREASDRGYDIQLISGDALTSTEFAMVAGPAADGTLITFFPDARNYREAKDVVTRFRADGYEPEGYTLQTYATIQTWAQAVEKAGSLDLDRMIEVLHQTEFDTVFGAFRFDDNGDMTAPGFVWYVWKDGEYVPVE